MKFTLKDYQDEAVRDVLANLSDAQALEKSRIKFIRSPVLRILVNGQSDIVPLKKGKFPLSVRSGPDFMVTIPVKQPAAPCDISPVAEE